MSEIYLSLTIEESRFKSSSIRITHSQSRLPLFCGTQNGIDGHGLECRLLGTFSLSRFGRRKRHGFNPGLSGVKQACFGHFPTVELGCDYGDYERAK